MHLLFVLLLKLSIFSKQYVNPFSSKLQSNIHNRDKGNGAPWHVSGDMSPDAAPKLHKSAGEWNTYSCVYHKLDTSYSDNFNVLHF